MGMYGTCNVEMVGDDSDSKKGPGPMAGIWPIPLVVWVSC